MDIILGLVVGVIVSATPLKDLTIVKLIIGI